jgi:hypothetical protein
MGRKTYSRSAGRSTATPSSSPAGGISALPARMLPSVPMPGLGRKLAAEHGVDEVMIIAGDVFSAAMRDMERIYLTLVHGSPAGDVLFALPDPQEWREISREPMPQTAQDQFPADFIVLDRKH